jgi:rod shape-determining protein MreC
LWQNYLTCATCANRTRICRRPSTGCGWSRPLLLEDARQGQRLQALLDFQQKYIYKTLAAQAIGSSGSDQSRVFYIDKGSADGLARDMAVITPDGIVGKVREVFPHSAQVLAINDQTSGAGVILETTRIRGILRGNAAGAAADCGHPGRPAHPAGRKGADRRRRPDLPARTAGGRGGKGGSDPERDSFIDVIVKPAAHLDRLDEVLVITSTEPRFSPEQQQDLATSEALKGARPSRIQIRGHQGAARRPRRSWPSGCRG